MGLRIAGFSVPKAGNSPEEYEDAWAASGDSTRLAVADGASDSFEARLFAKALVDHYAAGVPGRSTDEILSWMTEPIRAWQSQIQWDSLPWYGQEKAARGAFATIVGVEFQVPDDQQHGLDRQTVFYNALALGDACLFVVRDGDLIVRFPLGSAEEFGTTPPLLSTRGEYNIRVLANLRSMQGELKYGDLMLMATDAMSACILRAVTEDEICRRLGSITEQEFVQLIDRLREERKIENDDVTLVRICLEAVSPAVENASQGVLLEPSGGR